MTTDHAARTGPGAGAGPAGAAAARTGPGAGHAGKGAAARGEARPVRAEGGEFVEVAFTVNGAPVTLRLPPRVTLADALREHLGLTGTHLGCEHGVCGMCTVLVDGRAARACLLFAVQLDGADVLTVEGLGKPDDLHPLQEAFGRNHALQCGFCTPGFLMSGYDLLTTRPDVPDADLPYELSGVLCRCTGYRNIVTAVRAARDACPDGPPAPRALTARTTTPPAEAEIEAAEPDTAITLPAGEPTATVQVTTRIDAGEDAVWRVLDDVRLLATCLPGAELTEDLGGDRYAGRARVAAGPIRLAFHGVAHLAEHDRAARRIRVLAQGRDTGGAQTQAEIILRTAPEDDGTALSADARLYLTGRIAQFGRSLAGDVSRRMFASFAAAVRDAATGAPAVPAKPPNAIALALAAFWHRIRARRGG